MKNVIRKLTAILALSVVFVGCTGNNNQSNGSQDTSGQSQEVSDVNTNEDTSEIIEEEQNTGTDIADPNTDLINEDSDDVNNQTETDNNALVPSKLAEAVQVALDDLGVNEDQVVITNMSFDKDAGGENDYYEVEIYQNGVEYLYDLNENLEIIGKSEDTDPDDEIDTSHQYVSFQEIISQALSQAGVSESDIVELSIDLEEEVFVYEVEVETSNQEEREFSIDAVTG